MASFDENGKYVKTNWKAGDKITATKLNKIEESIEAVNDNDISRHVEADARLDALEAKDAAHDKELTKIKNDIADNKAAAELGDYDINSRMTFLENELNEGIEEVHNVAETVDGKIATAEANMTNTINTAKNDMEAMVAEVDSKITEAEADMEAMVAEVDSKITEAEADMEAMVAEVDSKITEAEADMTTQVTTARNEMTAQVNNAKSEMTTQVNNAKSSMTAQVTTAKNEMTAQVNNAKSEMTTQVNAAQANMTAQVINAKNDMEAMLDEGIEYMQDMMSTVNAENLATKDYVNASISGSNHVKTVNGVSPNENGNVVIPAVLDAPTVVDSIDEMTDTDKAYVLSTDGFIYTYRRLYTPGKLIPNFTNRLNTDGTGFTLNTRLSTSSTSVADGVAISNAISSKKGDVIYVKNLDIFEYRSSYMRFGMWLNGNRVNAVDGASAYYLKKQGYTTTMADGVVSFRLVDYNDGSDFSSDWDTIKFNMPMLDNYSECIITVNEPITYTQTETTYAEQWTSTGILFTPSDYGSEIAELKTITSNLAQQINNNSTASNDTSIPNYWVNELETKAETVREIMETVGRNKSAFLWYTDAHWQHNAKKSPLLLDYLLKYTPINKVNFGGDIVGDPSPYNHDNIKMFHDWGKAISNIPNHHSVYGNHDLNHWSTDVHNMAYALVLAREESDNMVVGDIDGCYYIDNPSEKTRYLYLSYLTSNISNMLAQGQFICDAIKSVQEGWHIVAIAHRWFQYSSSKEPTVGSVPGFEADILAMFDRYNAREKMISGTNYFTMQDFTDCKGKVEFCIGGHIHADYDFTSNGGIPVIITTSDTNQERHQDDDDCGVSGTITEQAVYAIIADYAGGKINVIGIGRGESREVSLN